MNGSVVARVVGVLAVVLALAAGAIAVSATSSGAAASPKVAVTGSKACDRFVQHLASDLGRSESDVRSALKAAAGQTIDDAVRSGSLTSRQGSRIKDRLNALHLCPSELAGLGRDHRAGAAGSHRAYLQAAADALGISREELRGDLGKGMTLHQIADARQISEQQFRRSLIQSLSGILAAAVRQGKLSQAQETQMLARLENGPLPLWDRPASPPHTPAPAGSSSPAA